MNAKTSALRSGFLALLSCSGERLQIRGAEVTGVVDRDPFSKIVRSIDFNPRDNSRVRLLDTALSALPRPGEEFIDLSGQSHRVEIVKRLGGFVDCECVSSTPLFEIITTHEGEMLATFEGEVILLA